MHTARQSPLVSALALVSAGLLIAVYLSPMWWVSLTAPNYPAEVFPDGIRIHFGFQGVANGCTSIPQGARLARETQQEDLGWRDEKTGTREEDQPAAPGAAPTTALDCMHEMNTINHYVGMHPMEVGAPVERAMARFIFGFFAVLLVGFAVPSSRVRAAVLTVGFLGVTGWMATDLFVTGHLDRLVTFFIEEAGKYFRDPERLAAWGHNLRVGTQLTFAGLVASMAFLVFGTLKWPRFQLVVGLIPALLPVYFVGDFAAWLWFFGHNLHPWGAFTVKPFMPTVFGDGKVAQFSTHSYPHPGFAFAVAVAVLMLVAVLRRRFEFADAELAPAVVPAPAASPTPAAEA